jgi:hypothetical protein
MVRIAAKSHVLHALSNQSMPWWKALAELVDNSLDANAFRVTVDVTGKTVSVIDDGSGVQDICAMFTLGEHKGHAKKGIGLYGIGAKDAWLSCADTMTVETVRGGMLTKMSVDYKALVENDWETDDPVVVPTHSPTGTKVVLPLRRGKKAPSHEAYADVAFAFTPAIEAGKQLFKSTNGKRQLLEATKMPERTDVVKSEFDIDGKPVSIDIGILPDGVKFDRGPLWVVYEHRIIERGSRGAGQYSARRLAGIIKLGDGWKDSLSKNKDDITDDEERLADAIFARIEPILLKADKMAESIESNALRNELADSLNEFITEANKSREKRDKGDSKGSRSPAFTGRKRSKAAKTTDALGSVVGGGSVSVGRRSGFVVEFFEGDPATIGHFERGGCRVWLNTSHPFVSHIKAEQNKMALLVCCASLIADHVCRHDDNGKPLLKFNYEDFASALGGIVSDSKEERNAKAVI